MAKTLDIPEYLRNILLSSTVKENVLFLPQQLDRSTYMEIDKLLKALGGKWNRSAKGHVFSDDPRKKISEALEVGEVVDVKKTYEFFETPQEVVNLMTERAVIQGDHVSNMDTFILEPSAGQGAIADVVRNYIPIGNIHVVELNPENREILKEKGYQLIGKDFLKLRKKKVAYDRVVMNPPFSGHKDIDHVMHAWKFLRPGGRLVSVMSAGVEFRQDKKTKRFQDFVQKYGGVVEPLPESAFRSSGTDVNTVLLTIDKPL